MKLKIKLLYLICLSNKVFYNTIAIDKKKERPIQLYLITLLCHICRINSLSNIKHILIGH